MVTCDKRLKLLSSLDRFLLVQCGVNNTQQFRIYSEDDTFDDESSSFCEDVIFRMITRIHNAVNCSMKVLEVKSGCLIQAPSLTSSSIGCGSMRSLFVCMQHCKIHKALSLTSSSNLEYLKLSSVCIEDEGNIFKFIFMFIFVRSEEPERDRFSHFRLSISGDKLEEILIDWELGSAHTKTLNILLQILVYEVEWEIVDLPKSGGTITTLTSCLRFFARFKFFEPDTVPTMVLEKLRQMEYPWPASSHSSGALSQSQSYREATQSP
ncbi:hypothetical protein DVH24_019199 [Malus domestica]|uniref:Uncharacterized protein n=1 Tax=Malus domestica TaxID=3750 RepID=A0A498I4C3_MALDO|nr:hypothetical protein DVH24_019199 [Malus domestica]